MLHKRYIRTCQECGNEQRMRDPDTITDRREGWRYAKCRKCKGESLDYGSWRWFDEQGVEFIEVYTTDA